MAAKPLFVDFSYNIITQNIGDDNSVLVDDYSELNYPSYIGDDNNPIERDPYKPTRIK